MCGYSKVFATVNTTERSVAMRAFIRVATEIKVATRISCVAKVINAMEVNIITRVCTNTIIRIT